MTKLSVKDFDYYKDILREDEQHHSSHMMNKNMPDSVIAAYEGFLYSQSNNLGVGYTGGVQPNDPNMEPDFAELNEYIENWMAISIDTIIPGFYYQVPLPNIRKKQRGSEFSAEILNGLVEHFFDEKAKIENQRCILDAYLAYSIGIMKIGYNTRIGILNNKRTNLFSGEMKASGKDLDMESSVEYIKYERPFVERVSPRDTWLDCSKEFGKGQRVTFRYDRTLQELKDSNLYSLSSNFLSYFKSNSEDARRTKLQIKECWWMMNGYAYKLVYTDDWEEELYWGKTRYQWLPVSLLRFKDVPDTLYTRSHGSIATSASQELDYQNRLWKEHIDKSRDLLFYDETGLSESGKKTLMSNPTKGVVGCTRSPVGVATNVGSAVMSSDIYNNIANIRTYLQQSLASGGAISGDLSAELAVQERSLQQGNFLRTSGIRDKIRDFNIDQIKKMITCLVNWGSPEVAVSITKKNIVDPMTGVVVTGKDVLIGGNDGIPLQEMIIGNIESDYGYDVDMASAARPDYAVLRKQLMEYMALLTQLMPMLQAEGNKVNFTVLAKQLAGTFDTIPNAGDVIEPMSEEELARQALEREINTVASQSMQGKGTGVPQEEAIMSGAENAGRVNNIGGEV